MDRMEADLARLEAALARLEAVADSLSRGTGVGPASGASVGFRSLRPEDEESMLNWQRENMRASGLLLTKEELEAEGKRIDAIIEKQRHYDASPPIAD